MDAQTQRIVQRAEPALPGIAHALEAAQLGNDPQGCVAALAMFLGYVIATADNPVAVQTAAIGILDHTALTERAKIESERTDPFAL